MHLGTYPPAQVPGSMSAIRKEWRVATTAAVGADASKGLVKATEILSDDAVSCADASNCYEMITEGLSDDPAGLAGAPNCLEMTTVTLAKLPATRSEGPARVTDGVNSKCITKTLGSERSQPFQDFRIGSPVANALNAGTQHGFDHCAQFILGFWLLDCVA